MAETFHAAAWVTRHFRIPPVLASGPELDRSDAATDYPVTGLFVHEAERCQRLFPDEYAHALRLKNAKRERILIRQGQPDGITCDPATPRLPTPDRGGHDIRVQDGDQLAGHHETICGPVGAESIITDA
jgi:hypothetical protein